MKNNVERYSLFDIVRAIAIINMTLYHFLYDINIIFGKYEDWWRQSHIMFWEFCICTTFIIISGISWNLGKNNLKRGIWLNILGILFTIITAAIIPNEIIIFGILSFMGCADLIVIAFDKILRKINPFIGVIASVFFFLLAYKNLWKGYIGIGKLVILDIPNFFYNKVFLVPFGFRHSGFYSSDFFPIMPWIFMYILGYYLWKITEKHKPKILFLNIPILSYIGKKSLIIYIVHQPVCFFLAYAICKLF